MTHGGVITLKLFRWILWSGLCVFIVGCNWTAPKVVEDAAPGAVACSVGDMAASRVIQVQVWRGRESGLSSYGVARVCQRLHEVGQQLLSQGVSLRFEVLGSIQSHSGLGRANNAAMQSVQATAGQLKLVIVDAIAQCGDTAGYILGCTPQLGLPVLYVKKHDAFDDPTPEWVIWAHEMGHAVALYHPDAPGSDTVPERIMTYMPLPQSTVLTNDEAVHFAQLGAIVGSRRMHAAQGLRGGPETRIAPEALLAWVQEAGPHGVSLAQLSHLDDAALLRLATLLDTGAGGNAQMPSLPVRTNALVLLAELGQQDAQAYVRQYLRRATGAENLSIRQYGLEALGRGQQRHRSEETLSFLAQASDEQFWCASAQSSAQDCAALAESAREALREAQSKP
jgi:hypothetical protein